MFQGIVSERLAKSQIGARHPVRRQVPDKRFPSGRPMIDIATEILQSLQARNRKRIGMEEVTVIHPLPWGSPSSVDFRV